LQQGCVVIKLEKLLFYTTFPTPPVDDKAKAEPLMAFAEEQNSAGTGKGHRKPNDRGSGGKNVFFSNSPNFLFEYSNLL
jgi:hypothetical protein